MGTINMIIDLDGTIYRGNQLVEHAKTFFAMFNESNVNYKCFTNCSNRTPREVAIVLKEMGLDVRESNIITSGCIVLRYLQSIDRRAAVYVVGSASFKEYLHRGNVELVNGTDRPADYVIVGFCTDFTYDDLSCALWHIQKGAKFITTNMDDTIPVGDDIVPHTGAICAFLEYASKQEPFNMGKPSKYAGAFFREMFGSDDVLVVGDRIDTDMLFARNNGFTGCLVLTGIAMRQDTDNSKCHYYNIFNNLQDCSKFIECKIQGDS